MQRPTADACPSPLVAHSRCSSRARARSWIGASRLAIVALAGSVLASSMIGARAYGQVVTNPADSAPTAPTPPPPAVEPIGPIIIIPQVRWRHRPEAFRRIELAAVSASVLIENQIATTGLEMTLTNPLSTPQEAQIMIPVPEGCTVRSLQYDGTGPEPTAKLLPKDEARRIYNSIVGAMRDPALLEFAGYNLIKSSVFPIPANSTQKVCITYEQLLPADGGRIDFMLPRSDSPQSGGTAWAMSAVIKSTVPISTVFSPSHGIVTERVSPTEMKVTVPASAATNPGALRISYLTARPEADQLAASLMAYPDTKIGNGKGGYFLLLTGLPATPPPEVAAMKREITIVIDRSGSMRGKKIEQAKAAAVAVLDGLKDGEFFNVIDYSDSIGMFSPQPIAKDAKSGPAARAYVQAINADGGTNLHDALLESLRSAPAKDTLAMVIFLTDGLPTVGERSEVKIREAAKAANVYNRRVFTFGVGFDVNTPLLSAVARASRGAPTFVLPEEDVEAKVSQVYRRLTGPVLASPKVTALDENGNVTTLAVRELQPGELPDMFDGDQLVLLGQYTSDKPLHLKLEGVYAGKPKAFEYKFDTKSASMRNAFVGRLWAQRRIGGLVDQIRQASVDPVAVKNDPRTKELVEEIVRLSLQFGIMTEYTSFLATEPTVAGGGGMRQPLPSLSDAPAAAMESLTGRSTVRSGAASVNQEMNLKAQVELSTVNASNFYMDSNMREVTSVGCQQVADQALFFRNSRWIDARIVDKENEKPDLTVEFGTPEFEKVLDQLVAEGRQSLIANSGEMLLLVNNQRVLVKCP